MTRFKSAGQVQRFLSAHDQVNNLFHLRRDHVTASQYRAGRARAFETWVILPRGETPRPATHQRRIWTFRYCRCGDARTTPKMSGSYLQPACSVVGGAGRVAQKMRPRASAAVGVAAGARRSTVCEDGDANRSAMQFGGE